MARGFSQLDVVNACITSIGLAMLNTLEPNMPQVQVVLGILKNKLKTFQQKEWYFNREVATLPVDPNGFVYISDDITTFRCFRRDLNLQIRGQRLYDMNKGTYVIGTEVQGLLVRELTWDELPQEVQGFLMYDTMLQFCNTYEAEVVKINNADDQRNEYQLLINEKEILNSKTNYLESATAAYFMSGIRPQSIDTL